MRSAAAGLLLVAALGAPVAGGLAQPAALLPSTLNMAVTLAKVDPAGPPSPNDPLLFHCGRPPADPKADIFNVVLDGSSFSFFTAGIGRPHWFPQPVKHSGSLQPDGVFQVEISNSRGAQTYQAQWLGRLDRDAAGVFTGHGNAVVTEVQQSPPYHPCTYTWNVAFTPPAGWPPSTTVSPGDAQAPTLDLALRAQHERPPTGKTDFLVNTRGDFILTVTNVGNKPAGPLLVSDMLPAGMTFLPARSGGATTQGADTRWTCDGSQAPEIVCQSAAILQPGQSTAARIAVDVSQDAFPNGANGLSGKVCRTVQNRALLRFQDENSDNNQALDDVPVCVEPDLGLQVRGPPSPLALDLSSKSGETLAPYTLTVTNVGSSGTNGPIEVVDHLAEGTEVRSAGGAGAGGIDPGWACDDPDPLASQISCRNNGSLGPGEQTSLSLSVVLRNGHWLLGGPPAMTNSARVTTAGDEDPFNDESVATTAIARLAVSHDMATPPYLSISKRLWAVVGPDGSVQGGGPLTPDRDAEYRIKVSNLGPGPVSAPIVVRDILPLGETFVNGADRSQLDALRPPLSPPPSTPAGASTHVLVGLVPGVQWWQCTAAGQVVTCTAGTGLQEGESLDLYLRVHVGVTTAPRLMNTATLGDVGDSVTTAVATHDDLVLTKTLSGPFTERAPGEYWGNFTISVANDGWAPAPGPIRVFDSLGPGLRVVEITPRGFVCAPPMPAPQQVQCVRAEPLPAGDSAEIQVVVQTDAVTRTNYTNLALLVDARGKVALAGLNTNPRLDLQLENFLVFGLGNGAYSFQDEVEFGLRVTNVGEDPAAGPFVVRDVLPPGLTFELAEGSKWICATDPSDPKSVVCTIDAFLEPGDTLPIITLKAVVILQPRRGQLTVTNKAVLDYADANLTNNLSEQEVTIVPLPDLAVSVSHAPAGVPGYFVPSDSVTYTLAVTNVGGETANGEVRVTQELPRGLSFLDVAGGLGWQCTSPVPRATPDDTQEVTCANANRGGLDPNVSLTPITVVARVDGDAATTAILDYPDDDPTNNVAVDVVRIGPLPDLATAVAHDGNLSVGQRAIFTIAVRNVGEGPTLAATTLDVALSPGLRFNTARHGSGSIDPGWSCSTVDPVREKVTCSNLGILPPAQPGQSRPDPSVTTLDIVVDVIGAGSPVGTMTVGAVVTTPGDTNRANDAASETVSLR